MTEYGARCRPAAHARTGATASGPVAEWQVLTRNSAQLQVGLQGAAGDKTACDGIASVSQTQEGGFEMEKKSGRKFTLGMALGVAVGMLLYRIFLS